MSAERLVMGNAVIEYGILNLRFGLITRDIGMACSKMFRAAKFVATY